MTESERDPTERSHTDQPGMTAPEDGRIGYGRYARYSPLGLAAVLVIVLLAIGIAQRGPDEDNDGVGQLTDQPAPDFSLTLLDGSNLQLSSLRGSPVVLNFWADWCAPCKNELPRLQTVADELRAAGQPVTFVGVGSKSDYDENARNLITRLGLTFPIGRDLSGDDARRGLIEQTYGVTNYPTTVFIRADGVIEAVHIGELEEDQIRDYVARTAGTTAVKNMQAVSSHMTR